MLVVEGLIKAYGDARAVQDVSLAVPAGQFVGVVDRSRAGKSTLLNMLDRLAAPTSGRIVWRETDVTRLAMSARGAASSMSSVPVSWPAAIWCRPRGGV